MQALEAACWDLPWGADADHLKTRDDVRVTAQAGFTFFTADPSEFVDESRALKDRKFYRMVEAQFTDNGRCILVSGPKERVSRGPGFVGQIFVADLAELIEG